MAASLTVELLRRWLQESRKIPVKQVRLTARKRAAYALLQLCREHCSSIGMLLVVGDGRHVASALSLLRSSQEALLRGGWIHKCLDDAAYVPYCNAKAKFPGKDDLFNRLKKVLPPVAFSYFEQHAAKLSGVLPDFSHGGHQQILRRFDSEGGLKLRATKDEERFVVHSALLYDSWSNYWLAELAEDLEAQRALAGVFANLDLHAIWRDDLA